MPNFKYKNGNSAFPYFFVELTRTFVQLEQSLFGLTKQFNLIIKWVSFETLARIGSY